jgi:subtilase family serine protease
MASAICPNCNILLVEASTNSLTDIYTAVDKAASYTDSAGNHPVAISNSYGTGEYSSETSDESHYNHPGIAVTASTGDNGYGVGFPATSQYVTAVGGTHLTTDSSSRGWTETVWSGAGSGCSAYITKPSWQTDSGCGSTTSPKRTTADVSADSDPNTGVAVYDTYNNAGGWLVFGGTSVASPIIASVSALTGNDWAATGVKYLADWIYHHTSYTSTQTIFDITSGSNGSCGGAYLCTAGTGYDGPTGVGTPDGTGAF